MTAHDLLPQLDAFINSNLDRYIDGVLARLVAVPSVAAQNRGIEEGSQTVADLLREHGYRAEIMPTGGSPVVYGEGDGDGQKTLLFYLHYDVQPAEPLELWESDPFTLTRRGEQAFGRGISDDKGHIAARLMALEAVKHTLGKLPCKVKFVIEGEEEIGSIHMPGFVSDHKDKLRADACVWEFGQVNEHNVPVQYLGMRGICYVELSVKTARIDSHSGLGGSIFPNAAWRLVWALNTLKDQDERVLVNGHYDSVKPATERDLELLALMPDNAQEMLDRYQLQPGFLKGMTGGPELRRMEVFEPTCTICGLTSGYQGAGSKTVLPAEARAKVDFRLVPDQTPEEVLDHLRKHLDEHSFQDVEITFLGGGRPARTDPDHPFIQLSNRAAEAAYGVAPIVSPMIGGSGPNYPFTHVLGLPITTCGLGYPGTQAHAPNENIVLSHFKNAVRHTALIVAGMGEW